MFRFVLALLGFSAFAETKYLQPPKEILDVLRAPLTPAASLNPAHTHLLLLDNERYPPIAELAQPMLRLAGHRMNPATNGPHMEPSYTGATLVRLSDLKQTRIDLPKGTRIGWLEWSGDGRYAAFTNTVGSRIELWVLDVTTA